jgi:hypothetical protein
MREARSSSPSSARTLTDPRLETSPVRIPLVKEGADRTIDLRDVSVAGVDYRYELRRSDDELIATGHLSRERPLELGDRIEVGGQDAIVRTIEPLLGEPELRLVLRLLPDCS